MCKDCLFVHMTWKLASYKNRYCTTIYTNCTVLCYLMSHGKKFAACVCYHCGNSTFCGNTWLELLIQNLRLLKYNFSQ